MAQKNLNTELKTITLSELPTPDPDATATGDNITKITNSAQLQDITVPLIAQTPTQAMHQPVSQNQIKRVELPGSIGNALSLQQNSLDAVSQKMRDTPASPGQGRFTLQLSGASKFNTLDAFAKQQKLTDYHINETKRAGKPWFVLVSGDYASLSAAKKAITTLPADVQTKKPWVRSAVQ